MSEDEKKDEAYFMRLASAAANEAIKNFLIVLGVDASNPHAKIELQKDFAHVRETRLAIAAIRTKAMLAAVGVVVSGALGLLYVSMTGGHR